MPRERDRTLSTVSLHCIDVVYRRDFHYDLPAELIAQYPPACRHGGRLLELPPGGEPPVDRRVSELPQLLRPGDLLVFNDTRVLAARLFGRKASGGRVELLIERLLDERRALVHLRASKSPRPGSRIDLDGGGEVHIEGREDDLYVVAFGAGETAGQVMQRSGHMPLPPYLGRGDEPEDRDRYQTVYARRPGSVAAPTAGLHFDEALLQALSARGVEFGYVTLHVGAGTFRPVRAESIADHRMHTEVVEVPEMVCGQVARTRARGGRVVAVGTTSVRALETASQDGMLRPFSGETRLFIQPGYRFSSVDAMITNFHLPESTLLMLVCAFAGTERVMAAYRHAVDRCYRFLSYGDAMLIFPAADRPGPAP